MFPLLMLADVTETEVRKKNLISFIAACIFVPVYAYSHIDMSHHFLSDVCFGTLIGYLICAAVSEAFLKAAERNTQN